MKIRLLVSVFALLAAACSTEKEARQEAPDEGAEETVEAPDEEAPTSRRVAKEQTDLEIVAELDQAPGNITVTPDGQTIVSLHQFYEPNIGVATVGEDGSLEPFPNDTWSKGTERRPPRLDSVLGVQSTPDGVVWMLYNGMRRNNTPALLAWDTREDKQAHYIEMPQPITAEDSFVNDLAVDTDTDTIYIADPAGGANAALIVADIETGKAKRVLEGHESTIPEDIDLVIDGDPVEVRTEAGELIRPRIGVDPIALDADNEWLYFGPMHGESLYRVPTAVLRDGDEEAIAAAVERYADKPICDGISMDREGNIYISDLTANAVGVITPEREYKTLVSDDRLEWPDAFSFGPDGKLYTVANQLHKSARLNAGEDESEPPFYIFRLEPLADGVVGR